MCLFWYACEVEDEYGGFRLDGLPVAEILKKLPRPIRICYTLHVLSGEVSNGGFWQWLASGQIMNETLEDLKLIGAANQVRIVEQVLQVNKRLEIEHPGYEERWIRPDAREVRDACDDAWSDKQANLDVDRLELEFAEVDKSFEDPDAMWTYLVRYIREHVHEIRHQRSQTKPPLYD